MATTIDRPGQRHSADIPSEVRRAAVLMAQPARLRLLLALAIWLTLIAAVKLIELVA
jgi:hypothetical protein